MVRDERTIQMSYICEIKSNTDDVIIVTEISVYGRSSILFGPKCIRDGTADYVE